MLKIYKNKWLAVLFVTAALCAQSCGYYDPDLDNTRPAAPYRAHETMPYTIWMDQLKQTDEKRYQEYVLMRRHIDSNHAVVMYRIHILQDSLSAMQRANNQQVINLRKDVRRLNNAVLLLLCITVLFIAYLLFEQMQKRRRNRMAQTIQYKAIGDGEISPAIIVPDTDDQPKT